MNLDDRREREIGNSRQRRPILRSECAGCARGVLAYAILQISDVKSAALLWAEDRLCGCRNQVTPVDVLRPSRQGSVRFQRALQRPRL
jgi:hypothetical protein